MYSIIEGRFGRSMRYIRSLGLLPVFSFFIGSDFLPQFFKPSPRPRSASRSTSESLGQPHYQSLEMGTEVDFELALSVCESYYPQAYPRPVLHIPLLSCCRLKFFTGMIEAEGLEYFSGVLYQATGSSALCGRVYLISRPEIVLGSLSRYRCYTREEPQITHVVLLSAFCLRARNFLRRLLPNC